MNQIRVGDAPPPFRLPSGQGPEIGVEDYRGRSKLVVWFTKGFGCAFCRAHMAQMVRSYPAIRERGAEVLEVSVSKPEQGRLYLKKFSLPFPYLCDDDYRARTSWGVAHRPQSLTYYAKTLVANVRREFPSSDFGPPSSPPLGEIPRMLADDDTGFFILDRAGVARFARSGTYLTGEVARPIPTEEEILRALESCD
jgi:peroxiredoxin